MANLKLCVSVGFKERRREQARGWAYCVDRQAKAQIHRWLRRRVREALRRGVEPIPRHGEHKWRLI